MELLKDSIEIKTLCENKVLWAKKSQNDEVIEKGNIYLFNKQEDGTYLNDAGFKLQNLDNYLDINSEVNDQVDYFNENLDKLIQRIDYQIENNQLKFLGFELNFEFLYEFCLIILTLVVGII